MAKGVLINVQPQIKEALDKLKLYKRETYGDTIERLVNHWNGANSTVEIPQEDTTIKPSDAL